MLPDDRADLLARVQALLQQCRGPQAAIRMVDLFALATGDVIVPGRKYDQDRKSTRLNSSHIQKSRMPSSA